ncbi:MAG: hypothetical protein KAI66_21185, partial [Lentisphaeria bacterium]|nr:hypothetical protein [Lentisphaeria bacterium]
MRITYKPDILGVQRLFLVVLELPKDSPEVTVEVPSCIALLDRTPLPVSTNQRRYYFRTLAPAEKTVVTFRQGVETARVELQIWSFDDLRAFRKLKGVQLPRRWPLHEELPELKTGQTLTDEAEKARMKGRRGSPRWLQLPDDQIWALQPDSTIPRWHWTSVREGCPEHGKKIYDGRAFYPWLNDRGKILRNYTATIPYTWKIICPVGGESYPSNDFANDDFTSGAFPDDGIGGACTHKGRKYGFIAELAQAHSHQMLRVPIDCARDYMHTGDPAYVHKALVGFCRLAAEFAYLGTMTQHRHRNRRSQVDRLGQAPYSEGPCLAASGFTVYCIDLPGYQNRISIAYDRIWPAIDDDQTIIPYLQQKGFDIQSHEDVRRFIEENLMAVWMQGAMDGATASNAPYSQWGLASMAEMLDYQRGDEFMEWLYNGGGNMRIFVPNTFFRDGAPYESSGGYNGMHVTALGPIVESIDHLRKLRPGVYTDERFPNIAQSHRYHNVFDFSMNTVNIDRVYSRVGDDGSFPKYSKRGIRRFQNGGVAAFEHAYKLLREPKFAWALANTQDWKPSPTFPFTREEIVEEAAKWPDDWNDASRLSDGYGLAMLRSGTGTNKRSLWMMYGRYLGHNHDDLFHMGLDAFESEILGHLGYPRNWNYWTKCWITQNLAKQIPFAGMTATPQLFVDAGPLHVAEALAVSYTDQRGKRKGYTTTPSRGQRRTLALVDVDDETFYCVDLFSLWGGTETWWTFHAQEDEGFATEGVELVRQKTGTLAGPDVPYGDEAWMKEKGCSHGNYGWAGQMTAFPHLYNVQRGVADNPFSATWKLKGADGLQFRTTVVDADGAEAIVCDGKSPAGASPYEMKWLLLHHKPAEGKAITSRFATLMELYRDQPVIRSATPLRISGSPDAVAMKIELETRTDYLFAAIDADTLHTIDGGFEFAGRFGLYSESPEGALCNTVLVGGTRLTRNGLGIVQKRGSEQFRIAAVDRSKREIVLDGAIPKPEILIG